MRAFFLGFLLLCTACATLTPEKPRQSAIQNEPPSAPTPAGPTEAATSPDTPCLPCAQAHEAASNAACFHLVPGAPAQKDKKGKTIRPGRMCQPQSLIYARCRSGIMSCRLGNTSPEAWFACAAKAGNTTTTPQAGAVMVLASTKARKIFTGHPVYVEKACREPNGTWSLTISHTNYDRQCHLDRNAHVTFDPKTMTATFHSGPWATWAKGLQVRGFIVR
ncbi:MAG: hypothetical protein JG774_537 [Desulfomicrobiaceae bacterium]|jgi:hypothetical protein|nr:hypothetical protein [Desulfomicrobiaceae bacterium]